MGYINSILGTYEIRLYGDGDGVAYELWAPDGTLLAWDYRRVSTLSRLPALKEQAHMEKDVDFLSRDGFDYWVDPVSYFPWDPEGSW